MALIPHASLRITTVNASFLAFCSLLRAVSTPVMEIASPDPRKAPSLIPSAMSISLLPSTYACSRPLCYAYSLCSFRADFSCSIWLRTCLSVASISAICAGKGVHWFDRGGVGYTIYIDTNGDLKACMATQAGFSWVSLYVHLCRPYTPKRAPPPWRSLFFKTRPAATPSLY